MHFTKELTHIVLHKKEKSGKMKYLFKITLKHKLNEKFSLIFIFYSCKVRK